MAGRSAILAIKILADARPAEKGMKDVEGAASKTASGVTSHFKRLAGVIAGSFALDKTVDFLKDSVQGYQDHLTVLKQTAQVIKTTGGAAQVTAKHVGSLSDSIEANTGIDGDLVQSGANMLLTFTNLRNEVGKGNDIFDQATKITTDMSAALGTDLKGQAVQVGKALNDPIKGVSALSRVGVTFTAQQKKQIAAMVGNNNTLGAQKLILKELGKEFGGTAHSIETPTQAMAVQFHALQDQVGAILLPVLTTLMHILTAYLLPVLIRVIGFVQRNAKVIGIIAAVISPLIAAWAAYVAIQKVVAIYTAATTAAQLLLNASMEANPIGILVVAIAALVAGLIIAYKKSATFRAIVQAAFHVVIAVARTVANFFTQTLPKAFSAFIGAIRSIFGRVVAFLRTWGPRALLVLAPFIGIPLLVYRHFGQIVGWLKGVWSRVMGGARGFVGNVVDAIRSIPGRLAGFAGHFLSVGKSLIGAFFRGIGNVAKGVGGFVGNIASSILNAIISGINNTLNLPWTVKLHIPIPAAPDVNFGPYTLVPRIPSLGGELPPVPTSLDDLSPGWTMFAAGRAFGSASVGESRDRSVGPSISVEATFTGLVTDPEGVARQIKKLVNDSARRNGLAAVL